jgi:hypothetical protein
MMESIENKGITATIALKNEVAGKTKPLFRLAKRRQQPERYVQCGLKLLRIYQIKIG